MLEQELRALQRDFALSLDERLDQVSRLLLRAQQVESVPVELEQARQLVHSLHGTAGTYGFDDVSQKAAEVEALLTSLLTQGAVPTAGHWRQLSEALDRCRAAVPATAARADEQ